MTTNPSTDREDAMQLARAWATYEAVPHLAGCEATLDFGGTGRQPCNCGRIERAMLAYAAEQSPSTIKAGDARRIYDAAFRDGRHDDYNPDTAVARLSATSPDTIRQAERRAYERAAQVADNDVPCSDNVSVAVGEAFASVRIAERIRALPDTPTNPVASEGEG